MSEQDQISDSNVLEEKKLSLLDQLLNKSEEELHPWEACTLPSKGVYYEGQIPDGVVEVKPLGLKAEKILTTQRLVKSGEALEKVYAEHVRLPEGFEPQDLLEGDREFLLYYLRGISHGHEYEFLLTCPECNSVSDQVYDLNELWGTAKFPNPEIGPEPFPIVLPHFSEILGEEFVVRVRFLRGKDVLDLLNAQPPIKRARRNKKGKKKMSRSEANKEIKEFAETLDTTLELNINKIIVEADGDPDRFKIRQLVERMSSSDVSAIITFLAENAPGIDTSIVADCSNPQCASEVVVPLPITDQFFRPKRPRRTRE
jgi:hypothetical protein